MKVRRIPFAVRASGLRWIALTCVVCVLAACQCIVKVSATGTLDSGIAFSVVDDASGRQREHAFVEVFVFDISPDSQAGPVWQIGGNAKMASIRYGEVPPGMHEMMPATALRAGRIYRAGITVRSGGLGLAGYGECKGAVTFRIGSDGTVSPCSVDGKSCS